MIRLFLFFFIFLGASACSSYQEDFPNVSPHPTTNNIQVFFPASLSPLQPALELCAAQQPNSALIRLRENITSSKNSIIIEVRDKPITSTKQIFGLGMEKMEFIVNPGNPVEQLSIEQIKLILSDQLNVWPETQTQIELWLPNDKNSLAKIQSLFLNELSIPAQAFLTASPATIKEAISKNMWAMGILPSSWVDKSVKTVKIPNLISDVLQFPILAHTKASPSQNIKLFLECLQSGDGQKLIQKYYFPLEIN